MMFRTYLPIPEATERVASEVIGASIEVHRELGPGFLERIYLEALCLEMHARNLKFQRECPVDVLYRGVRIPGQRIDLIVERCVIVELKAATRVDPPTKPRSSPTCVPPNSGWGSC